MFWMKKPFSKNCYKLPKVIHVAKLIRKTVQEKTSTTNENGLTRKYQGMELRNRQIPISQKKDKN